MSTEAPAGASAGGTQALPTDPAELNSSFLRTIEAIVAEPVELPPQARETPFRDYSALFPKEKVDQDEYGNAVVGAHKCRLPGLSDKRINANRLRFTITSI